MRSLLSALVVAVVLAAAGAAIAATTLGSSTAALERAKGAVASAESSVKADEAALSSGKATLSAAREAVVALEAQDAAIAHEGSETPKEEPKSAEVSSAPTGPTGSWTPVFADGFGKPVGGGDTSWTAKTNSKGCCGNSNETSSESPSAVHWSEANGLELRCEGLVCSGVSTPSFTYQLGRGASFVFQAVAQLPDNALGGGEDPGFWSISTTRWPPEIDFFEWWGWGSCESTPSTCLGGFPVYKTAGLGTHELFYRPGETGWSRLHTYTTVVTGSTFTEYVDGVKTGTFTQAPNTDTMNLILTHAVRQSTKPRNSSFTLRSVAVYEDSAHAGQFVTGGGIAPGTTVK